MNRSKSRGHRLRLGWVMAGLVLLALAGVGGSVAYRVQKVRNTERLLAEAKAFLKSGNTDRAIETYSLYLERSPQDPQALRDYATLLYAQLDTSRKWIGPAINALRKLNRIDPQDAQTIERLAKLYMRLQQFGLAEELARAWLKAAPHNSDAIVLFARAATANNKSGDALEALTGAAARDPKQAAFYPPIIDLLDNVLEREKDAEEWVNRALQEAPTAYPVHLASCAFFQRHGQIDEGRRLIERALESAPDVPEVLQFSAQFFTSQGDLVRARTLLDRVPARAARDVQYLSARKAYALATHDEKVLLVAAEEFQQAADSGQPILLAQAAELYLRAGALPQADRCIETLEAENQQSLPKGTIDVLRGARKLMGDEPYAAITWLESAMREQPSDFWTLELLARAYLRIGELDDSADLYRRLALLGPSLLSPRLALARLELQMGRTARAREVLNSLANVGLPQKRLVQWLTLLVELHEGDESRKIDLMRQAEMLAAAPPEAVMELELAVNIFVEGGQPDRAMELFRAWSQNSATRNRIGLDLARQLVRKGDFSAAAGWAALLRETNANSIESRLIECDILLAQKKYDEAHEYVTKFSGAAEDQGKLWDLLADRNPNPQAKLLTLSKAAQLRPRDIGIRQKIARLAEDLPTAHSAIDEIRMIEGEKGVQWKFERASALLRLDHSAGAALAASALLKESVEMRSGWAAAHGLLGFSWERLGELSKACESYRTALAQDSSLSPAAFRLVDVLKRLGRYQEADAVLAPLAQAMPGSLDVQQLLVEQAVRRNDLSSAASLAEQILRKQSDNATWAAYTAELLLRAGQAERAERMARDVWEKNPGSFAALTSLTQALLAQKKYDEALALTRKYARQDSDPMFQILAVRVLLESGKMDEAQGTLESALKAKPDNATLCAFASEFWGKQGDRARQLTLARQALQVRGEDPAQSIWLASMLVAGDARQREEAQTIIRRVLSDHADDPDALLLEAQLALTVESPDVRSGATALKTALKRNPRFLPARKLLASVLIQEADLHEASEIIEGGLLEFAEDSELLLLSAQVSQLQGEFERSLTPLRKMLATPNPPPPAAALLVAAAIETHQVKPAIAILEAIPKRRDAESVALARLYEAAGYPDKAAEVLQRIVESSPALAVGPLLQFNARQRDYVAVEDLARRYGEKYPEDTATQLLAAELLASEGSAPQARQRGIDLLDQIAAKSPFAAADARFRAGLAYLKHGDFLNAETMLIRANQLAPQNPKPVNALAWLYGEELSNTQRGLELIKKYESEGGKFTAELLDTYGLLLYRVGRLEEATTRLNQCLRVTGQSSDRTSAMFHLGLVQKTRGANSDASVNFRGAMQLHDRVGGLSSVQVEECRKFLNWSSMDR